MLRNGCDQIVDIGRMCAQSGRILSNEQRMAYISVLCFMVNTSTAIRIAINDLNPSIESDRLMNDRIYSIAETASHAMKCLADLLKGDNAEHISSS